MLSAKYLERGEDHPLWGSRRPVAYQVDFWTHLADKLPDTPPEKVGYKKDAYLLTGAEDVHEVMAWVEEHAEGRIAVVHIVLPHGEDQDGLLLHLSGADPTIAR